MRTFKHINRRDFLKIGTGGIATAALAGMPAWGADTFPSKPIDIIVPFSVGGGTDIWMRAFSIALASKKSLRNPVNIRNIPGAASLRGAAAGFNADPDGHTLTAFNPPSTPWAWYLNETNFDITQFKGIGVYVREPGVIVANASSDISTFEDLVSAYNSGAKTTLASQQKGTIWHVAATLLQRRNNVNWSKYVSYKGTGDIIAALMRKEVEFGIVTVSSALDSVKNGTLKALAIIGATERLGSYPDTPTMNELGMDPLQVCMLRRCIFAPAGIAEDRRLILEDAIKNAQDSHFVQAQYNALKLQPAYGNGAEAEKAIADSIAIAKEIDLKALKS